MGFRAVRAWTPLGLALAAACGAGRPEDAVVADSAPIPPSVRYDQHVLAGGKAPAGASDKNPFEGNAKSVAEGKLLWSSMNCDGCHGGGEGWAAPSLSDGRWRYGGSDPALFQSIYYGRPKGMPAFGGLLSEPIIWKLVTYLRSLPVPKAVPTQAW